MGKVQTYNYKTDIDCATCLETVRKILDTKEKVNYWYINPIDENHLLTLMGEDLPIEQIIQEIHDAGFSMEKI